MVTTLRHLVSDTVPWRQICITVATTRVIRREAFHEVVITRGDTYRMPLRHDEAQDRLFVDHPFTICNDDLIDLPGVLPYLVCRSPTGEVEIGPDSDVVALIEATCVPSKFNLP